MQFKVGLPVLGSRTGTYITKSGLKSLKSNPKASSEAHTNALFD